MSKWMLAAGAAALAIMSPALAERGGQGGGKDRGGQSAKVDRGGGGQARAQRGGGREVRAQRGGGERQARAQRGGGDRQFRTQRGGGGERVRQRSARVERQRGETARGGERRRVQSFASFQSDRQDRGRRDAAERQRGRQDRAGIRRGGGGERVNDRARVARFDDDRGRGRGRDDARLIQLDRGRDQVRGRGEARLADVDRIVRVRDVDRGVVRFRDIDRDELFVRRLGFGGNGCPPGLAKKGNGCLPPGQAAKLIGSPLSSAVRLAALEPLPRSLRSLYWDDDDYYYRYGGGYLYRVDRDRDLIDSLIPLFGAALIGQPFQQSYRSSYVPPYYNAFYPNSPYDCYQYGYSYVYETDCMTGLVEDVIPTYGYGYGVGQILPASYGYYNVPYPYRSSFIDDDDYYYRYAPGAIYRVDRDTALISTVAALLTGNGLTVGQPLPIGYSAYNVPLGYRTTYYDRPDVWYRYDNGYVYSVDPRTRLVTAVVV